jgi:hypothetical protein
MATTAELLASLKTSMDNALLAVSNLAKSTPKRVTSELVNIAAGAFKEYDMQTLLGAKHAIFDKDAATVVIRVKDAVAGSATLGMYINSEAMVIYAVRGSRYVRVINLSDTAQDLYVGVTVPRLGS